MDTDLTATTFRKTMFKTMDKAIGGEPVTILYRGVPLMLFSKQTAPSKLERAVKRNALVVDPDAIIHTGAELQEELETKWKQEDSHL
ncbi:MAG: hypothetical protein JNK48_12035 [Bryobacterales bacterium]|nr:hypothetical protein [Bryobacterales bacterium]